MDRWRTALTDLFSHLHSTIRQSFIANFGAASAPAPGHSFTNSKPPAEQRHIDARGIVRNANGDPIHGGSTATLVVMVKDANGGGATLITANVGDSTAFLVPTRGTWDFLSVDHGPENQDEWVRINSPASAESAQYPTKLLFVYDKTNVFRKYECPSVFLPDGTKDQQYVANPWGYGECKHCRGQIRRRVPLIGASLAAGLISCAAAVVALRSCQVCTPPTCATSLRCMPSPLAASARTPPASPCQHNHAHTIAIGHAQPIPGR